MNDKQPRVIVEGDNGQYHEVTDKEARVLRIANLLNKKPDQAQTSSNSVRRGGRLGRPSDLIPTTVTDQPFYGQNMPYGGQYQQPPVIIKQYFGSRPDEHHDVEEPQVHYYASRQQQSGQDATFRPDLQGLSPQDELLALASRSYVPQGYETSALQNPHEIISTGIIDTIKSKPKVLLAGATAVALAVVVGVAAKTGGNETQPESKQNTTSKESNNGGPEFQLRPYEVKNIAKYDATITASTMWNFSDKPFEARYAVGTAPDDASWDFTTDPELIISVKLPHDPAAKNTALAELTKKDEKRRVIQIDMSKIIIDISVDPKTLDTTTLNLFRLATPSEQDKILTGAKLDPKTFRDTYEKNKNDAEAQAVGLAAAGILADPEHRSQILSRTKTKIMTTLGLTDNERYELRFISDEKFGLQATTPDPKYPGLDQQFPHAGVAELVKKMGYSGKQVRIINAPQRKPIIDAKLNEAKTA